jgi:chromosome segregation protein
MEGAEVVHLQAVRLRGFKTFAKPTELLLEPGVTVIIGPNGSGKSNIADAVLWVLGEQSPGSLRGRTMQDVMFSGVDGKRSSAVTEVSLVFDNGSGILPLDCSELEVTRRLTRDTGSEYRLNGNECRLLDIQDVVGALGLGREMHSVISQGKVEALLNSSPEARRAMVEEAAGLGRFKKRRERAQTKLDRTIQNLLRARDIEEEVRMAMRPLKQQVAAAERFADATEGWALARARLVLHSLVEVEGLSQKAEEELARIEAGLGEVGNRVAELRRQRTTEEESFTAALKERERLGNLYHLARGEADYVEGRTVSLRQRLARMEGELDRARRRRDLVLSDAAALAARTAEVTTATADEARLASVGGWAETLRKALEEALPAYRAAVTGEDELKDSVFELEASRSRALQDREFLRREKDERGRVGAELRGLLEDTESRLRQLKAEGTRLEKLAAEAAQAVRSAEANVRQATTAREGARDEAEAASRSEVTLAEVLAGLESRLAVLTEMLERREGLPAGARELLVGVAGCLPLTELLTVKAGYERAAAAALGPAIQAVVVPKTRDLVQVLGDVTGALEAIGGTGATARSPATAQLPSDMCDLWDVVSGPDAVIQTLMGLIPRTAVLIEGDRLDAHKDAVALGEPGGPERLVTRSGEMLEKGVYAARRQEIGAESLLAAGNELAAASREREAVLAQRSEARKAAEKAAAAAATAEEDLRVKEECLREAERKLSQQRSESDLCRRRVEECHTQLEELRGRSDREGSLAEELAAQLNDVEETMAGGEAELEKARTSLRAIQSSLEALRQTVGRLEDRKGRTALLEVRLRERCKALANERARVESQREAVDRELASCERRLDFLEGYVPVMVDLLSAAERLAGWGRTVAARMEVDVQETRANTEGTARVMRDWGSAEVVLQREYDAMTTRLTEVRIDQARLGDRRAQLDKELVDLRRRHLSPRGLTDPDVAGEDAHTLAGALERAERRRERIGPINPLAEQEYGQMEGRARFLAEQREDLEAALGELQGVIAELDEHIERSFSEIFEAARQNFSAVIASVFPGAKGSLRLTEARPGAQVVPEGEDAVADDGGEGEQGQQGGGIVLEVRFPNKAPRSLSLLSGGEKAMTAIAFLFSLFLARPCPFYILDEVEASLDDINIRRFLSLVRKYRDKTQFIIITHQRQTMEVADTLYGVALESDGTSRVLSRKMKMAKGA